MVKTCVVKHLGAEPSANPGTHVKEVASIALLLSAQHILAYMLVLEASINNLNFQESSGTLDNHLPDSGN